MSHASPHADTAARLDIAAHALLTLIADMPATHGRIRAARIVSGFPVAVTDDIQAQRLHRHAHHFPWRLSDTVGLVDALIDGGLLAQSAGPRPTLVLSRAGHHALDALEAHANSHQPH